MRPQFAEAIPGNASLAQRKAPVTLTSKTLRHASGRVAATGRGTPGVPALFMRMVTLPSSARTLPKQAFTEASSATSRFTGRAVAGEKTGRGRPDAASCAGYERDATGVYRGHPRSPAEKYVLAATDSIFHPRTRSIPRLAYPTHRLAAEVAAAARRAGHLRGEIEFSQRAEGVHACPTYPFSR